MEPVAFKKIRNGELYYMKNGGKKAPGHSLLPLAGIVLLLIFAVWMAVGVAGTSTDYSNSLWLNLLNLNNAPVITQGATASLAFAEDGAAKTLSLSATDDDGDALAWSVSSAPGLGTASVSDSGLVTYTPGADENGDDSLTVTVSDGNGGTDSIVISVAISAVNDAPVLPVCADVSVDEDCGAQTMPGWTAATPGPANEGGQTLAFVFTGNTNTALFAAGGEPAVSAEGTLTFSPAPNAHGTATLTLYAKDDAGGADTSATRTFTITVRPVNDAPVNTALPTAVGTPKTGNTLTATLGAWNDDTDGNPGTLTYATRWQSAADNAGTDLAELTVADSLALTTALAHRYVRAVVTVTDTDTTGTVTAEAASAWYAVENTVPSITETAATIAISEDASGAATLHAADADGDTLTWSVSAPAKGSASVTDGAITYTPNADENGTDSVTVTVTDGHGGTDSLDVAVTIAAVNDTPTFTIGDDVNVSEDCGAQTVENWIKALSAGADNEAGQTLTFTVTANTNAALFAAGGRAGCKPGGHADIYPGGERARRSDPYPSAGG